VWWVTCASFAALELWINFAINPPRPGQTGLAILGIAIPIGSMIGTDLGLEEYFSNRWIEFSPNGIMGVYRFHRTFAPWNTLKPMNNGFGNQSGFVFDRGGERRTQFIMTYEQMRAVVAYPHAPRWILPPKLAVHLGPASAT